MLMFQPIAWRSNPHVKRLHTGWSSLHAEQHTILLWPYNSSGESSITYDISWKLPCHQIIVTQNANLLMLMLVFTNSTWESQRSLLLSLRLSISTGSIMTEAYEQVHQNCGISTRCVCHLITFYLQKQIAFKIAKIKIQS